jgi:hydroxypyruvate isomerase
MNFFLHYTSHLGYVSPDEPLFRASVNSIDPWAHVEFASARGFAGVLYPWPLSRPEEEVARFDDALHHFGLRAGCIVYAPRASILEPIWMKTGGTARAKLSGFFGQSISSAQRLGSETIAVLVAADPEQSQAAQMDTLIDNLRFAGDQVAQAGVEIGVEPMIVFPHMFLQNFEQVKELFERVEHPAIKLIFDTGHVTQMGNASSIA